MKKKIVITLTDEQSREIDRLMSVTRDGDKSKMIRRLIANECQAHGLPFADNMPAPGPKSHTK